MDFDDFDWEDATILGAILGFVEESLEAERMKDPSEPDGEGRFESTDAEDLKLTLKQQLRLLANTNPDLARYVVRKAREQQKYWRISRKSSSALQKIVREWQRLEKEEKEKGIDYDKRLEALNNWWEYRNGGLHEKDYETYPFLYLVDEAIGQGWRLVIDYEKDTGERQKDRVVKPERAFKDESGIYLSAYCEMRKATRHFRVDWIRNLRIEE
jgi:hypothetical protein